MRTKEEILVDMVNEMPWTLPMNTIPYIKEAMQIYANEYHQAKVKENASLHNVSGSFVKELIDKYNDKINSAENLKKKGTGFYAPVPSCEDINRLDVRIYERKTFIEDLKLLLNDR